MPLYVKSHSIPSDSKLLRPERYELTTRNMVISSSDRAIRTFQVSPLTGVLNPIHRFQDLVNRTPWHAVGFSGDGEYVMGGAGHKMAHNVFIWDRDSGVLVKVLEGPRESLIYCDVGLLLFSDIKC
jgi:COMPASS component SWD1